MAAGLAHAHARGVVHRDLTPSNVLVENGTGRVVVTDFGLARLVRSSTSAPVSGVLAGTPEYWAPEQAAGEATGPATDVYALGCMLFQLLTGRLPFQGEDRLATGLRRAHEPAPPLASVAPGAPPEAAALVDRLLARDPEARGSATDAAVALGARETTLPSSEPRAATIATPLSTLVTRVFRDTAKPVPTLVTRVLHEPATMVQRVRSHRAVHRGRLAIAAVVAVAVVALLGGTVFAIAGGDPPGVNAPDAVGTKVAQTRVEIVRRAKDAGVPVPKVKVVQRAYSESAPEGTIVAQDPPEGERIPERGALLVSVSRGSAFTDVPSVAGLGSRDAESLLERTGFVANKRYAPSSEIAAWHAIETDPASGTRVKRPAHVQVTISTGPPRRPVPGIEAHGRGRGPRRARERRLHRPTSRRTPRPTSRRAPCSGSRPSQERARRSARP